MFLIFSNFEWQNKSNYILQHKDRIILLEIKDFFTSSEKEMVTIFRFINLKREVSRLALLLVV